MGIRTAFSPLSDEAETYKNDELLFESNVPGSYDITPKSDCYVDATVVGSGAGGVFNSSSNRASSASGSSGSGCIVRVKLKKGKTYLITVGKGGDPSGSRDHSGTGYAGGVSKISLDGQDLVIAPGGNGGSCWWPNGASAAPAPALCSIDSANENFYVIDTLLNKQGITGGTYTGNGGPSVIDGTTYGKGGASKTDGGGSYAQAGNPGYVKIIYKKIKKRYYKNKSWIQPQLSENGVFGGDNFAVSSSKGAANDYAIFNAGAEGTASIDTYPNAAPQWVSCYNSEPLKVNQIQIGQNKSSELNNYYIQSYEIQASDDNVKWERVFSASGLTPQQILTAEITDSGFHKYYRVYVTAAKYYSGYPRVFFAGLTISNAVIREIGSAADYDFIEYEE